MQITLMNGEKSPKFISPLSTVFAVNYTESKKTLYTMGAAEVGEIIAENLRRLYRQNYRGNLKYVYFYVRLDGDHPRIGASNALNDKSVEIDVELTKTEINKLLKLPLEYYDH